MSYKGIFKPRNPAKYKGDPTNIIYRSSYELKFMMYLDAHPDVIEWSSEEIVVPYRSPIDGKVHRYFPDFFVKKRNAAGVSESLLIEVKPYVQTIPPAVKEGKTHNKRYLREVMTWGINSAKWKAAESYCKNKNWKFIKMTEKDLNITNG